MTRTLAIAQAATGALLLAGCSDSTRTMDNGSDSRGAYASSGAYRYDEQGNRVYDQSYGRNADGSMTRQRDSFTSTDSDGVVKSHYGADGLAQNDRPVWDRDPATSRQNDTPVYNRDLNDKSRTYTSDRTSNGSGNGRDRLIDNNPTGSPNWNGRAYDGAATSTYQNSSTNQPGSASSGTSGWSGNGQYQSQNGQSQSWTSQSSQSGATGSGRYGTPQSGSYQNTNTGSYSNNGGQNGQWTGMRPDQSYNGSPNWRPSLDNSTTMSQTTGGMWGSDRNTGAAGRSGQQEWNDRDMTAMSEADLPAVVRAGFTTEANGSALSETGRTTWNGTQAYCAKVTRNGHPYKIVTDSDGSLLMMKRLD